MIALAVVRVARAVRVVVVGGGGVGVGGGGGDTAGYWSTGSLLAWG